MRCDSCNDDTNIESAFDALLEHIDSPEFKNKQSSAYQSTAPSTLTNICASKAEIEAAGEQYFALDLSHFADCNPIRPGSVHITAWFADNLSMPIIGENNLCPFLVNALDIKNRPLVCSLASTEGGAKKMADLYRTLINRSGKRVHFELCSGIYDGRESTIWIDFPCMIVNDVGFDEPVSVTKWPKTAQLNLQDASDRAFGLAKQRLPAKYDFHHCKDSGLNYIVDYLAMPYIHVDEKTEYKLFSFVNQRKSTQWGRGVVYYLQPGFIQYDTSLRRDTIGAKRAASEVFEFEKPHQFYSLD